MASTRPATPVRCTFCGGGGAQIEVDLRGVRYDYCDAACATAHRQAVELSWVMCADCDAEAVGDTGFCDEHVVPLDIDAAALASAGWRRAG
jgi:hypothetical protein